MVKLAEKASDDTGNVKILVDAIMKSYTLRRDAIYRGKRSKSKVNLNSLSKKTGISVDDLDIPVGMGTLAALGGRDSVVAAVKKHLNRSSLRNEITRVKMGVSSLEESGFRLISATTPLSEGTKGNVNALISAIEAKGQRNPMYPKQIVIAAYDVSVEVSDHSNWVGGGNAMSLDSIITFGETGQGSASKVLAMIVDLADKYGVRIVLDPVPLSSRAGKKILSKGKLVAWYKRHGFKKAGYDGDYQTEMYRLPKGYKE